MYNAMIINEYTGAELERFYDIDDEELESLYAQVSEMRAVVLF
ncbi:hypothetical protein [Salimicrobium humidisoli]|nr:hypothetical protein [Salimicrobium humidisoli]